MRAIKAQRFFFSYLNKYKNSLEKYYKKNELLTGWCTPEHSKIYTQRNSNINRQHWRTPKGISEKLSISSLGMGTYNGQPTNEFDYEMFGVLVQGMKSGGINMIDTCALYRFGKSEKVINAALNFLVKEQGYKREEFMISTKCGYVPHDIDSNLKEEDFIKILTKQKIIEQDDIVGGIHCVSPNFIQFSLEKSILGLGIETIDVLYLNNFSEAHLPVVGEEITYDRLRNAFRKLEQMRQQNRIRYYGLCSYVGLRSPQTEAGVHFQLQKAVNIAKQVGGQSHGFRFLMVPFSLGTPEILLKWQNFTENETTKAVRVFDIAEKENINIVGCSPLFQGKVASLPFQSKLLDYLKNPSAKHLQLIRSFPSSALLSTLVGMTQQDHLNQNLQVLTHPLLTEGEWKQILPIPE